MNFPRIPRIGKKLAFFSLFFGMFACFCQCQAKNASFRETVPMTFTLCIKQKVPNNSQISASAGHAGFPQKDFAKKFTNRIDDGQSTFKITALRIDERSQITGTTYVQ